MEPFENDEISDSELTGMLRRWQAPSAPARLRAAVFGEKPLPWWRTSIRVPVPLAAALLIAIVYAAIRMSQPQPVVVRTQRPDAGWRPVSELKPRIIRSGNVQN